MHIHIYTQGNVCIHLISPHFALIDSSLKTASFPLYVYVNLKRGEIFYNHNLTKITPAKNNLVIYCLQLYIEWLTNRGVVVQKVVENLGSDGEAADQSACQDGLLRVCDNALLYKFYNTITKHLRMNA